MGYAHKNTSVFTDFPKTIQIYINYFIIIKLTSINWFNSSRNVEDIEEKVDTRAKLK